MNYQLQTSPAQLLRHLRHTQDQDEEQFSDFTAERTRSSSVVFAGQKPFFHSQVQRTPLSPAAQSSQSISLRAKKQLDLTREGSPFIGIEMSSPTISESSGLGPCPQVHLYEPSHRQRAQRQQQDGRFQQGTGHRRRSTVQFEATAITDHEHDRYHHHHNMNNSTAVKQRNNLYNDHQASTQLEDSVDSLTVNAVPSTSASRTDVKLYPAVTITRSTTVISATSHNGRTKLTRRLSYLAHAGDLEDGAEQNIVVEGPDQVLNNLPEAKGNSPGGKEYFLSTKNHPQRQSPQSAVSPAHRSGGPKSRLFQDMNATGPVPIPKLYRRLLQVFRPPLESLDFDSGVPSADPIASVVNRSQTHGPLGLPSRSQNNNNNNDSSNNCGSLRTLPPNQKPSIDRARISSSAAAAAPNTKVTSPIHRPPESTGFRVRFLKKLMSSPNLNTVVHPMAVAPDVAAPGPCVEFVPAQVPPLPYSAYPTLTSDFEHEHSCPVSQRIQERCNGGRPSAVRLPREPARTPTLQSKYGVPGRELGAGTQAQVMLLRAKSPKKLKGAVITTASIERPTSADLRPEDAFLSPRLSSGMMTMTTEDEVTPEQREAYRRRLLQRTNTDQLPVNAQGGLIYAIKKFRPPKATETHRQYLKKVCAEFCISTSMDHENIIRTIDLVRDQPGQDLDDDDDDDGGDNNRDKVEEQQGRRGHYEGMGRKADEQRRDDDKDCSCPREHRRRVRAVESVSGSGMRSGGDDRQHTEAPSYPTALRHPHRSVPRRPVSVRAQRRRSVDSSSNRSSVIGAQDDYEGQYGYRHTQHLCHHAHHHRDCRRQQAHHHFQNKQQAEVAVTAATKKMKKRQQQQRLEQEMRRREVQRLKKQRQLGKKQHAKQLRLEQFPEYCMVMEFAAGGDLFQLLTRSSPPIGLLEKYCLWRQLVNGVQHMHSMGVAHRDLKPENLLIDATGRILKITDFGIANVFKSVGDPSPLPCRGIIGSEPYIAPEEFYQDEYDPRAVDVWACGIIFYVMYYSAMPWARADRKSDARFAKFVGNIVTHRYGETQRRLQFERRQALNRKVASACSSSSLLSTASSQSSQSVRSSHFSTWRSSAAAVAASAGVNGEAVPGRAYEVGQQKHQGADKVESPSSSAVGSPGSYPSSSSSSSSSAGKFTPKPNEDTVMSAVAVPLTAYNTFAYNGHIGGHEFIDRIETPGCRRVLYAILEPDARKRLTIEQVVRDEWVRRIRYCTDSPMKQEEQALLCGSAGANHSHAVPKKVRT